MSSPNQGLYRRRMGTGSVFRDRHGRWRARLPEHKRKARYIRGWFRTHRDAVRVLDAWVLFGDVIFQERGKWQKWMSNLVRYGSHENPNN